MHRHYNVGLVRAGLWALVFAMPIRATAAKGVVAPVPASTHVQAPKPRSSAPFTKGDFVGTWIKKKHDGGQVMGDVLTVAISPSGTISVAEKSSGLNSDFRRITYSSGSLAGTYTFTADDEHSYRFQLLGMSQNTIRYRDQRGTELFTRMPDAYTGIWQGGEQLRFVITWAKDGYRIVMTNGLVASSPSATFAGSVAGGRLVFSGDPRKYYKFQAPTLEALSGGTLMYRDGATEAALTRKPR